MEKLKLNENQFKVISEILNIEDKINNKSGIHSLIEKEEDYTFQKYDVERRTILSRVMFYSNSDIELLVEECRKYNKSLNFWRGV